MKQKLILSLVVMTISMMAIGSVLATSTRVNGNTQLIWQNAYDRPQQFSGAMVGDLLGTITLTTHTDYDITDTHIGTTWSNDVVLTLNNDNTICEGFYAGSTVNDGRNVGTFTLSCDNGNLIQGMMEGVNTATGDIDLVYTGFVIKPTPGPQGEQGIQGIQGEQGLPGKDGIDGTNGVNGVDGKDGLPGEKGENGLQGEQGIQGLKGDTGEQGIQGIPGIKGDKGDTGNTGSCTCDTSRISVLESFRAQVLAYPGFSDFVAWANNPNPCVNGQLRCSGSNAQKCINYDWVTQSNCQYGCASGVCNNPPVTKEDCTKKPMEYSCNSWYSQYKLYYGCKLGQGTSTSCNIGQCSYTTGLTYCYHKCNTSTGRC